MFRRKVNNTDKGDGYSTEEVLQDEYVSFFVENGLSLNVDDLGLDWAWNLRGFDGCFHQKTTLYMTHIIWVI